MPAEPTDTFHILGTIIRLLSPSKSNGGAFSLAEYRVRPGSGAPLNRHPGDDESFYVISGQCEFSVDGKMMVLGPGGFLQVPNGSPHHFRNAGTNVTVLLAVNAPGLIHEQFYAEAGDRLPSGSTVFPTPKGPPDIAALRAIAARCGITFVET